MAPLNFFEAENYILSAPYFKTSMQCSPEKFSMRKRKQVMFANETSRINGVQDYYSSDDVICKWLTPSELKRIRNEVKFISHMLRKQGRSEACYVSVAHHKTTLMLARDLRSLVKLSPHTPDEDLMRWNLQLDGRRGLERFTCRDYGHMRKKDMQQVWSSVFEEQHRQRCMGIRDEEAIAKASLLASRRSRTFAGYFGAADASCLKSFRDRPKKGLFSVPARKRSKIEPLTQEDMQLLVKAS